MRALGVDLGKRRIGLAVGESEFGIASPRPFLPATGTLRRDAQGLHDRFRSEGAEIVVIGLAENGGEASPMKMAAQKLGSLLEGMGAPVRYVDESLTTVVAEDSLRQHDLKASQRRNRRDGEAACQILERYFRENT